MRNLVASHGLIKSRTLWRCAAGEAPPEIISQGTGGALLGLMALRAPRGLFETRSDRRAFIKDPGRGLPPLPGWPALKSAPQAPRARASCSAAPAAARARRLSSSECLVRNNCAPCRVSLPPPRTHAMANRDDATSQPRPEPPPVRPPTLPRDFPDIPQNPSSELQPDPPPRPFLPGLTVAGLRFNIGITPRKDSTTGATVHAVIVTIDGHETIVTFQSEEDAKAFAQTEHARLMAEQKKA